MLISHLRDTNNSLIATTHPSNRPRRRRRYPESLSARFDKLMWSPTISYPRTPRRSLHLSKVSECLSVRRSVPGLASRLKSDEALSCDIFDEKQHEAY